MAVAIKENSGEKGERRDMERREREGLSFTKIGVNIMIWLEYEPNPQ